MLNRWIFSISALFFLLAAVPLARAATQFTAMPSATEIGEDENVSIEFKIVVEGMAPNVGLPKFDAPDFDEVNAYRRSQGVDSRFINGKLTVRRTQSIVTVLHPRKQGKLTVTNIQVEVDGQMLRAPDIVIDVGPAGSSRSRGNSVYPAPSQLPSTGVRAPHQHSKTFFLKAEPSKLKVYKGEQIILTYALYTRVQIFNVQVERYPTITGFLKEDIDIPLLRGRLDYTPSVVGGQEYRRAVLAQYAIYPVKDGKLSIDAFTGKFSYQAGIRLDQMDDDPFAMLNQFFRSMQTTTQSRSSDRVTIEVLPLPAAGQPQNFSGLVGDFDVTAVVDKYTTKVGEPINVKVKVEGQGHAGSLESLPIAWPRDFELYEDKSRTQFLKTGRTERLFEYMLIPRAKGKFEIPAIEISMFNPETKSYQMRRTEPVQVEVLEGSGGNIYVPKTPSGNAAAQPEGQDIRYWMSESPKAPSSVLGSVARGVAMASMVLAVLSLWSLTTTPNEAMRQSRVRQQQELKEKAKSLVQSTGAPFQILAEVEQVLAQVLEIRYGILIGSLTRPEIRQALLEKSKDETVAKRVEGLLELCENARFVPGGGDKQTSSKAAEELNRLVDRIYHA